MTTTGTPAEGASSAAGAAQDELLELLTGVCEVPAPTGSEGARARFVVALLAGAGLAPWTDREGSVLAWLPGGDGPALALAAHLDTVFAEDCDVKVRKGDDGRWRAPGIGDNSASVAVLLQLALQAVRGQWQRRPRLLLAFTVGEEGLGDLRGARRLVADHAAELDAFLAIDGHLGSIVEVGVGSRRLRADFRGPGGHSWGDFPTPSATHAAGDAVHALTRIGVPENPRSSMNVGEIGGGSAVNAIAEEAHLTLDLRSLDEGALAGMAREAEKRLRSVARRHEVELEITPVGERPAGRSDDGTLGDAAAAALREAGIEPRRGASSTDANAAMAAGLPAICVGVYRGGDAHRLREWLDPTSLPVGRDVLRNLLGRLATAPS